MEEKKVKIALFDSIGENCKKRTNFKLLSDIYMDLFFSEKKNKV